MLSRFLSRASFYTTVPKRDPSQTDCQYEPVSSAFAPTQGLFDDYIGIGQPPQRSFGTSHSKPQPCHGLGGNARTSFKSNPLLKITIMRIIQLLWFSYFRVYCFTFFAYNEIANIQDRILAYLCLSIYFMGLIWGYGQLKGLIKDI